ncbi:hypothetical protein KC343_g1331 [Hortaea werneckii]|nr:hypothetical protein KC352_g6289 [Hortaea werneckii]KAI7568166.1 hypothetical protein KC317_g4439 [Hortaea werneckii]KAI7626415.1 hypothetical protein KC346_g1291 [Hortaea werneckii]KAI7636353.1 hypothetical protein KC343_g1331 [Hortaea werneckii]KAI7677595.1 hypothetical protein KC319_g3810 [Hortaea werneckii]
MQPHAADQGKAAMADLMSIAKWKSPHASIVTWQAGLDEIDRFYRSDMSQSNAGPRPTDGYDGSCNEYNTEQAGFNGAQSLLGPTHEEPLSFSPEEMSHPVDYELTAKQDGTSLLQQEQTVRSLSQPASPVPSPAIKLHPPHASSSLHSKNTTSLPNLNQASQSTNIEAPPEPFPTHCQPPSEASVSNLLQPPTQPAKKLPLSHSQSTPSLSKAAQRNPSTSLLPQTHALLPLHQQPNPHWNSVANTTARPKWTLEPPPPPGLQPAFEGKCSGFKATGEDSRVAVPLREAFEKDGSRLGGGAVSGDGSREGCGRLGGESSDGAEGGGDVERRLGELRVNVTERDEVAGVTACRKGKVSDGPRDGTPGSDSEGNASSKITHTPAPDVATANEEHEHEARDEQTNELQPNDNTTTSLRPQDRPVPVTDPRINPNAVTMNPPRWSPTNTRTFSNARDEIVSLKRGRKNTSSSSSTTSYSSSPPISASSSQPPPKKKKKEESRGNQSPSVSRPVEESSEQGTPKESNPEERNTDYVHAPAPADQESQLSAADSDPPTQELSSKRLPFASFPSGSSPSFSKAKDKEEGEEEEERQEKEQEQETEMEIEKETETEIEKEKEPTKKRKRPPRPTMSKRELSSLEGTTVEGKLRKRGGAQEGRKQPQSQLQPQQREQEQNRERAQERKERKGQEEGKGQGKGKGEQKERKGKETPANWDRVARRKRQRRL